MNTVTQFSNQKKDSKAVTVGPSNLTTRKLSFLSRDHASQAESKWIDECCSELDGNLMGVDTIDFGTLSNIASIDRQTNQTQAKTSDIPSSNLTLSDRFFSHGCDFQRSVIFLSCNRAFSGA
jgi:hypothetical protein